MDPTVYDNKENNKFPKLGFYHIAYIHSGLHKCPPQPLNWDYTMYVTSLHKIAFYIVCDCISIHPITIPIIPVKLLI